MTLFESAGWMSPQLREAWSFRAEETPPANTSTGQAPAGEGQAPTSPSMTLEQALEALKAVRHEAAGYRTKATALEQAQAAADAAKLTKEEALAKKVSDLEATLSTKEKAAQDRVLRYEVQLAAHALGIVDPDAAVKLMDLSGLSFGDDGTVSGLAAALEALVKAKPYLVAQQTTPTQPNAPMNPARGNSHGALTLADVKKMSREQIAANYDAVKAALKAGR